MAESNPFDFRPMDPTDHKAVLELLGEIDKEDALEARGDLRSHDAERFVLLEDEYLIGLTGVAPAEETDGTAWLDWTAVRRQQADPDLFKTMLQMLHDYCADHGYRKVFSTETASPTTMNEIYYRHLRRGYEQVGLMEEVRHKDYYKRGEDAVFLGWRVKPRYEGPPVAPDDRAIELVDCDEVDECDGTYALEWRFVDGAAGDAGESTGQDVEQWLDRISGWGGHLAVISAPSNAVALPPLVTPAGFSESGTLEDFYKDGIHEIHFSKYL